MSAELCRATIRQNTQEPLEGPTSASARTASRGAAGKPAAAAAPRRADPPGAAEPSLLGRPPEVSDAVRVVPDCKRRARLVPGRRRDGHSLEAPDPSLLHAQRDGVGEPLVQRVGGQARQPILLRPLEKLLKAEDPEPGPRAEGRLPRHDAGKGEHDESRGGP